MDSRLEYRQLIKKILSAHAQGYAECSAGQIQTVFDDEHQHYLLLDLEWRGNEYIHHAPVHLDVIDGKIWIQCDDTEEGVATDLLEAGVPSEDIVLGFRHPKDRKYTGFVDLAQPEISQSETHCDVNVRSAAARTDSMPPLQRRQPSLRSA